MFSCDAESHIFFAKQNWRKSNVEEARLMCTKVKRGDAQKVWRKQIVSSANTADPAKRNLDQPWHSGLLF